MRHKERIGIVGAGVVGKALAVVLRDHYPIVGVASRSAASAKECAALARCPVYSRPAEVARLADLLLICTPDDAIQAVCERIASEDGFRAGQTVVHLSGALDSSVLDAARACGARAFSLHPVRTFADYREAVASLPGTRFSVEGDDEALPLAERLAGDLGGKAFVIRAEMKPLYHAALCVASNYMVTLESLAAFLLKKTGAEAEEVLPTLMPLIRGTVQNLAEVGLPGALTGPISRGDVSTIERQLSAIRQAAPEHLELYKALGALTLKLATKKDSVDDRAADRLEALLASGPVGSQRKRKERKDAGRRRTSTAERGDQSGTAR